MIRTTASQLAQKTEKVAQAWSHLKYNVDKITEDFIPFHLCQSEKGEKD